MLTREQRKFERKNFEHAMLKIEYDHPDEYEWWLCKQRTWMIAAVLLFFFFVTKGGTLCQ
jgi:hypothetical protein